MMRVEFKLGCHWHTLTITGADCRHSLTVGDSSPESRWPSEEELRAATAAIRAAAEAIAGAIEARGRS